MLPVRLGLSADKGGAKKKKDIKRYTPKTLNKGPGWQEKTNILP